MPTYNRNTTVDPLPGGDSVKQAILDIDEDLTGAFAGLNAHSDLTTPHGATGAVVGTTNVQTLTNKTLTAPKINEAVALTATATQLNRCDVTSSVQTQLNGKASLAGSPTQDFNTKVLNTEGGVYSKGELIFSGIDGGGVIGTDQVRIIKASDISLVFQVKGSDGVVRYAGLSLA